VFSLFRRQSSFVGHDFLPVRLAAPFNRRGLFHAERIFSADETHAADFLLTGWSGMRSVRRNDWVGPSDRESKVKKKGAFAGPFLISGPCDRGFCKSGLTACGGHDKRHPATKARQWSMSVFSSLLVRGGLVLALAIGFGVLHRRCAGLGRGGGVSPRCPDAA